eukprot:42459-Rhodomonas_salina.1
MCCGYTEQIQGKRGGGADPPRKTPGDTGSERTEFDHRVDRYNESGVQRNPPKGPRGVPDDFT